MVNEAVTDPAIAGRAVERRLVLSYARIRARAGLEVLMALDATLGNVLRTTREPLVGQMRLTWWAEALRSLDSAPVPAEPVLQGLAATVIVAGVAGAELSTIVGGWEVLLIDPIDEAGIAEHARLRGGGLFAFAARLLGGSSGFVQTGGEGWAMADLSHNLSLAAHRTAARQRARSLLDEALATRWPATLRPLGALAWSARMDLDDTARPAGHPLRMLRLLRHRATGR